MADHSELSLGMPNQAFQNDSKSPENIDKSLEREERNKDIEDLAQSTSNFEREHSPKAHIVNHVASSNDQEVGMFGGRFR